MTTDRLLKTLDGFGLQILVRPDPEHDPTTGKLAFQYTRDTGDLAQAIRERVRLLSAMAVHIGRFKDSDLI